MTAWPRRLRHAACVAASGLAAGGCFAYRTAQPAGLQPGEGVRLELSSDGARELTQQVGPRVTLLEGRVLGARDTSLALAVRQLMRGPTSEEFWTGDSVVVPLRALTSVSVRRLDRQRSALAIGGTLVALYVARRVVREAGIFGSTANPPPTGQ